MPIKRITGGIGIGNNSFPFWDLGAVIYWRSTNPFVVQQPGGSGWFSFSYTGFNDPADYYVYDDGIGKFRQVTQVAPEFPPDGFCWPARLNLWDNTQNSDRGFTLFDGVLTKTNPAASGSFLLDGPSTGVLNMLKVGLAGTASGQFSAAKSLSATFNRVFSVAVRRTDGGVVDSNVAILFCSNAHGVQNEFTTTKYRKIRNDGWYQLSAVRGTDAGASSKRFGVTLFDGYEIEAEIPALEGTNLDPQAATLCTPDIGTNDSKGVFHLNIASNPGPSGATPREELKRYGGWLAVGCLLPYATSLAGYPLGWILMQIIDANNFFGIEMSSTADAITAILNNTGNNDIFMSSPAPTANNTKMGLVFSWGAQTGSKIAFMAYNGTLHSSSDTVHTFPGGTPSYYQIGHDPSLTREPAVGIQEVVIGQGMLTRSQCAVMSRWLQRRVRSPED